MDSVKGKKQIERMNHLMYHGMNKTVVTESVKKLSNLEYKVKGGDGKYYGILRENNKYIIKRADKKDPIAEDFQYLNGVLNSSKQSYTSFGDAVKCLNLFLMENCGINHNNEMNEEENEDTKDTKKEKDNDEDDEENLDETETEVDEKTVLKLPKAEKPAPTPQQPQPKMGGNTEVADMGGDEDFGDDLGGDMGDDFGDDDLNGELGGNAGGAPEEIQKTTGELGQELRDLEQQDDETIKYVFNSIVSALNLDGLDPENKKQLLKKVKKKLKGEEEDLDGGDEDFSDDLGGDEGSKDKSLEDFEDNINEISTGLANKAFEKSYKSMSDMGQNTFDLTKRKQQGNKFANYINPELKREFEKIGVYAHKDGMRVWLDFNTNDKKFRIMVGPTKYNLVDGRIEDIDENLLRRLSVLIKKLQADLTERVPAENELEESIDSPFKDKKDNLDMKNKNAPFTSKPTKMKESRAYKTISKYFEKNDNEKKLDAQNIIFETLTKNQIITEAKKMAKSNEQAKAIERVMEYDTKNKIKQIGSRLVVETNQILDIGGKEYKKSIFVESNGNTYGVMRELKSAKKVTFRVENKKDYQKFLEIGK